MSVKTCIEILFCVQIAAVFQTQSLKDFDRCCRFCRNTGFIIFAFTSQTEIFWRVGDIRIPIQDYQRRHWGGGGLPRVTHPSSRWRPNEIFKKLLPNWERTLEKRGRKVGVVKRRQLKRSLCRLWWLKKSSFFFKKRKKYGWHHQLPPRVTPTLVTPMRITVLCVAFLIWAMLVNTHTQIQLLTSVV